MFFDKLISPIADIIIKKTYNYIRLYKARMIFFAYNLTGFAPVYSWRNTQKTKIKPVRLRREYYKGDIIMEDMVNEVNERNLDDFGGKFYLSQFQQIYIAASSANRFKQNSARKKTK